MKQASNPKMPAFGKALVNRSEVSEKELIYHLGNRTKGAVLLCDAKKAFMKEVIKNQAEILEYCDLFDGLMASSLANSVKILIPATFRVVDKSNNSELAVMIAKLLPPLRILCSYINTQYEEESKRKGNLRSSTKNKQHRTVILKVLDKSYEILEALEDTAIQARGSSSLIKLCKPIKLTDSQRERKWSSELVPTQKYLQICPSCDHQSTNLPPENAIIVRDNREKERSFVEKLKKWDQYIKDKNNGNENAKAPDGMTRKPYRRDFK